MINCTTTNSSNEIDAHTQMTYDIIGYVGGSILSICLIPQIVKMIRTQSAKDISYVWQITCLVGLIFIQTHNILKNILPLVIPGSIEIFCYVLTLFLKIYYDYRAKHKETITIEETIDKDIVNSPSNSETTPSSSKTIES